jgi:hypothetical protein
MAQTELRRRIGHGIGADLCLVAHERRRYGAIRGKRSMTGAQGHVVGVKIEAPTCVEEDIYQADC